MFSCDKSFFEKNWQAPLAFLENNPSYSVNNIEELISSADNEDVISGSILAAAMAYRDEEYDKLLAVFAEAQERLGSLPDVLRVMRLSYHAIKGDLANSAYSYAFDSYQAGRYNQALEEMRIAFVADYRSGNEILNDSLQVQRAMAMYLDIAKQMRKREQTSQKSDTKRFRIGLLVPNLVDESVAYSKRVMFFSRFYNEEAFEMKVYSSEDLCREGSNSFVRGKNYIEELKSNGIEFWASDPKSEMMDAAKALRDKLEEDQLDALILQIDPAMPIAWLAAYQSKVKKKFQIHIGSAIYMPGLDAVLYDNETVMSKDAKSWPADVGRQVLLRRGTDIVSIDKIKAKTRAELNISEDKIIIGCLSNHLTNRMSYEYKNLIADLLVLNKKLVFMPVGNISDESTLDIFKEKNVLDQLVLPGGTKEATAHLKLLDIYASEFPEGGSQAVVEAMVCSLPIVAMMCGSDHHKSISSEIIGAQWAIKKYDLSDYKKRLERLIFDEGYRRKNSEAMRKRALELFSIDHYVTTVCNMLKEI